LPVGYRPDGIDIIGILRGNSRLVERQLFWRFAPPNQKAVRSGRWKLLVYGRHHLLFDLQADPGERTDLTARHPQLVVTLKNLLADWKKDVDQKDRPSQ
jgi:arylsulfatase A-like enzyme